MEKLELVNIIEKISKEENCEIKPIPDFFGDYYASNKGEFYSYKHNNWALLRQSTNHKGYKYVTLYSCGIKHQFRAHRLILEIFHGEAPPGYVCNHKNGIKTDNRIENLEWTTHKENVKHAFAMGLRMFINNQPSGKDHWTQKLKKGDENEHRATKYIRI